MALRVCFLGSFGGTTWSRAKKQDLSSCQNNVNQPSLAKRRRTIVHCTQELQHPEGQPSRLDGELKDILNISTQDLPDAKTAEESDRRIKDGITETGVKEIEDIADEVKGDLEDLQRTVEETAAKLIEEETQAVLEKYDQKREELLGNLKKDREIISTEMEHITELTNNVKSKQGVGNRQTLRETAYFLMCSVFTVSALYFAWIGITDADSAALTNAAIDTAVAAACTFAFSLEKRKRLKE